MTAPLPDHGRHESPATADDAKPGQAEIHQPHGRHEADQPPPVVASDAHETEVDQPPLAVGPGSDGTEQPPADDPQQPVLRARGLGLRLGDRPVFAAVDLDVEPASVVAVVGLAGTGRSALLLALTGRMSVTEGILEVSGTSDLRRIRATTAVARITGFIELEDRLTVAEAITERSLLDGVRVPAGERAVRAAADLLGLSLDGDRLVEDLSARDRTLLAVAVACARPAAVIVLDDLDGGLHLADQADVFVALTNLAASGPAIVVSTTDRSPLPDTVRAIELHQPEDHR